MGDKGENFVANFIKEAKEQFTVVKVTLYNTDEEYKEDLLKYITRYEEKYKKTSAEAETEYKNLPLDSYYNSYEEGTYEYELYKWVQCYREYKNI